MNKKNEKNEDDNDKGGGEEDKNNRIKCFSNNNINVLPEIDNMKQKRFSHNVSPQINQNLNHINPKECMTFFSNEKKDNVSKDKKTIFNDNFKENDYLFKEANKERKLCLKKIKKNNYVLSSELPPSSQFEEEELEEGEEYEEIEDLKKLEEEEFQCNCSDILIVDDEKFNVMASQRMIKNIGYQTDAAYNGEECINLIKEKQKLNCNCNKNHYKLILLDIVMPELDGISTAKKVQEMITNKEIDDDIKIVFVSGNIDGEELKNSLLQIECVKDCLQKPVGIDKYRKILEKYYK
jgi:CheY-like chemotaxis protein